MNFDVLCDKLMDSVKLWSISVAEQEVHDFKSSEERSKKGEAKVSQESRGSVLENAVSNELEDPSWHMDIHWNLEKSVFTKEKGITHGLYHMIGM